MDNRIHLVADVWKERKRHDGSHMWGVSADKVQEARGFLERLAHLSNNYSIAVAVTAFGNYEEALDLTYLGGPFRLGAGGNADWRYWESLDENLQMMAKEFGTEANAKPKLVQVLATGRPLYVVGFVAKLLRLAPEPEPGTEEAP